MKQLLTFTLACNDALTHVTRALTRTGLRVTRSFDLQVARAAHVDCACPHHGTKQCDCQMIVLLVYGSATAQPATLVCHGRDGRAELILADAPEQRPTPELEAAIVAALNAEALAGLKHDPVVDAI